MKKDCRFSVKCFICKTQGSHNTALCTKNVEREENHSLVVNNSNCVLLHTADAHVCNTNDQQSRQIKIIFDSCSQQTYITENVVKSLKLKPIRKVKMSIKSFGNTIGQVKTLSEYEVCVKPTDKSSTIYVKAVAVPMIFIVLLAVSI